MITEKENRFFLNVNITQHFLNLFLIIFLFMIKIWVKSETNS